MLQSLKKSKRTKKIWVGWVGVSRAILDRELEKNNKKLNYKGPCRVKKNSRHPKNIWIEPTPPTHPLPIFFFEGGGNNIIKDFNFLGGFPIFYPKWPGYTHPPTLKLSLNVWIFFIFATSLKQYQHYIQIKKKQTTGLYYLFIYLFIQPSLHEEVHIKLNMQEH